MGLCHMLRVLVCELATVLYEIFMFQHLNWKFRKYCSCNLVSNIVVNALLYCGINLDDQLNLTALIYVRYEKIIQF